MTGTDLIQFELIFNSQDGTNAVPNSYTGMKPLQLTERLNQYTWRSMDYGQTYEVTIAEDFARDTTSVIVRDMRSTTIDRTVSMRILNQFYPGRTQTIVDTLPTANAVKYTITPGVNDHELPWYKHQLIPDINFAR